jgi:cytochrome c oxidase cbb3-type subunit 3
MTKEYQSEEAPIRPYEADGIQELDHNLPSWWVGLFVFTTIFAGLYLIYVHLIGGTSIQKEYEDSLKITYAASSGTGGDGSGDGNNEPTELHAMIGHSTSIAGGKATFNANCAACHGAAGQGTIGPNLTDKFWIHGGKPEQIYATIFNGVVEKGMPPWGAILGEHKTRQLTAYIASLKGTNPPNPKAPQGNEEP